MTNQCAKRLGELHIEGFEVSHTKDGFRWGEYEEEFLELLKEELEKPPLDLLAQAENYRVLPSRKSIEKQAAAATETVAHYIETDIAPVLVEAKVKPPEARPLPLTLVPSDLQASERTVCINDGDYDWVITIRTSVDPRRDDWVSMANRDPLPGDPNETRRLVIDLALAHPFSSEFLGANYENIELFLRVATAVCISLVLAQDLSGQPPEVVLLHFNQLMRGALSQAALETDDSLNQSAQNHQAAPSLGA